MSILSFFRKSAPAPRLPKDDDAMMRLYKKLRWQSFIAGTVGYSLYYVCRTSLNVVKKPILESGALDATQLGVIGSALLFAYAIGKFVNGFLSDHSNIKRFMAAGLAVSAVANLLVGILGLANGGGIVGNMVLFVAFAVMWGVNGWSQSMGAPPAIIALSRWYPLSKRGTYYGFFSASHNLGEFLSFLFVGAVVGFFGWQWGFVGSSVAGVLGVLTIVLLMHDTPESKGLPPIEELTGEETPGTPRDHGKTSDLQRSVIRNPLVWVLALSSAFMYISRYAINGWGVLFLQEIKGYTLAAATQVISVNALCGIVGTVFSGWLSDAFFYGRRNVLAFGFGVLNTVALCLFLLRRRADRQYPQHDSVRRGDRRADLFSGRPDGHRHRTARSDGRRAGNRRHGELRRRRPAGHRQRLAHQLRQNGAGRRDELQFRLGDRLLDRRVGRIVHSGALRRQTLAPVSRTQLILRIRLQEIPCSLIFYPAVPFSALSPA